MKPSIRPITITAPRGLLPFLKNELTELGFPIVWAGETALGTRGVFTDTMRMNMWLRTAHHVLYQLKEFACRDLETLYRAVVVMPWESLIPLNGFFSVVSSVDHPSIRDHRIVNLKCKDAIADRIAARKGRRPDSGSDRRGAVVTVFWNRDRCSVSIDTSGEPLSKRGYRKIPLRAPMQETLASAVVRATNFSGNEHFVNPMCGSGTLAIEAALSATGRASGLTRDNFGFMHTLLFDETAWGEICRDARSKVHTPGADCRIIATDNDEKVVDAACSNAAAAGVQSVIEFSVADFMETSVPAANGVIIFNPEYGIRLGNERELVKTYRSIGKFMKQRCQGYRGYIFTGNATCAGNIGLRSGRKLKFQSGKIDCRLYEYDLYHGKGRC
ncbi:MAG: hypothetical protein JW913_06640 [Chitinispirillaceae bacterium]|nr:hypothetical protein [Chitinispirillaceae bacterium]